MMTMSFPPPAAAPPARILVVDDSALVREWTLDVLVRAGFEVQTAADIWVAGQVREFQPDLVLMDVTISTMSGANATRALKTHVLMRDKPLRVVLYSVQPPENLERLAAEVNADGYIVKSDDAQALVDRVRQALAS